MAEQAEPAAPKTRPVKPDTVRLATTSPYQSFDPGVPGVGVLTNTPVPVPRTAVDAVHAAAAASAVELKELR